MTPTQSTTCNREATTGKKDIFRLDPPIEFTPGEPVTAVIAVRIHRQWRGEFSLRPTIARLRPARDRLVRLAEQDVEAYARVIEARRLPNDTPAQHLARHIALQHALREATDVPLDMMHVCEEALRCGVVVSNRSRTSAKGDLAIGIELISVALRGAARAVDANLSRFEERRLRRPRD